MSSQSIPDKLYVTVHGIGDAMPDYWKKWDLERILGVKAENILGFYYEDLMEGSDINTFSQWLMKPVAMIFAAKLKSPLAQQFGPLAAQFAADYVNDIFTFFLSKKTRRLIGNRMDSLLAECNDVTVFAHSLGSLFLLWYCWTRPTLMTGKIKLVLLGCPYGSPVVGALCRWGFGHFLKVDPERPEVPAFRNIWSECDPLSGPLSPSLISQEQQHHIEFSDLCRHREVDEYIEAYYKQFNSDLVAVDNKLTFAQQAQAHQAQTQI